MKVTFLLLFLTSSCIRRRLQQTRPFNGSHELINWSIFPIRKEARWKKGAGGTGELTYYRGTSTHTHTHFKRTENTIKLNEGLNYSHNEAKSTV